MSRTQSQSMLPCSIIRFISWHCRALHRWRCGNLKRALDLATGYQRYSHVPERQLTPKPTIPHLQGHVTRLQSNDGARASRRPGRARLVLRRCHTGSASAAIIPRSNSCRPTARAASRSQALFNLVTCPSCVSILHRLSDATPSSRLSRLVASSKAALRHLTDAHPNLLDL